MVFAYNPNRDQLSTRHHSRSDITLNFWEYNDLIDALLDDKLTAAGLMKMKRLRHDMWISLHVVVLAGFSLAWACSKWLQGWNYRGMASIRPTIFGMVLFLPTTVGWAYTRPIPRKAYTDVIADSGLDGSYIRESLRTYKPGLWVKISNQLHQLKFDFPEMHQFKGTTFPSNFVNSQTI